jgi:hypothetical protein
MSVLNDILTQECAWVRDLAGGVWCGHAGKFLDIVKHKAHFVMRKIEFGQNEEDLPEEVHSLLNHYWREEDGTMNWGLPGGTFAEFCDRLKSYACDWRGERWIVNKKRETSEGRARDLLLASYLFPFLLLEKHEDPCVWHGMLPALAEVRHVKAGSRAIVTLVSSCIDSQEDGWHAAVEPLSSRTAEERISQFEEFSSWMLYLENYTGTNPHDADIGARRAATRDSDSMLAAQKFVDLGAFARECTAACELSHSKAPIGQRYKKIRSEVIAAEHALANAKTDHVKRLKTTALRNSRLQAYDAWTRKKVARRPGVCYRRAAAPALSFLASDKVVLVRNLASKEVIVLTHEDVKNLRYVSMTHSLWHVYASTLDFEYVAAAEAHAPSPDAQAMATLAGQLGATVDELGRRFDPNWGKARLVKQQVVPLATVKKGLKALWAFYTKIAKEAASSDKSNTMGRYLHEAFAVYTSELGGHLAKEGYDAQHAEFIATYAEHGYDAEGDLKAFSESIRGLPISVVQDFGRLSKIVQAYDVSPLHSFIHRTKKMIECNPIGEPEFLTEFSYRTVPHTSEQDAARKLAYECASNVMTASADIRDHAYLSLSDEERQELEVAPHQDIISFARKKGRVVRSNVGLRETPEWPLPGMDLRALKAAARKMLNEGAQPTDVHAGAFLDVENLSAYKLKDAPDISHVKATSLPLSDFALIFTNVSSVPRSTPTSDTDGNREKGLGNMISNWMKGEFPSRAKSLLFLASNSPFASTSDKVETSKWPKKTRIITGMCGEARRIMSEYEDNNGRTMKNVPGFTVGADPAAVQKLMYTAMKQDLPPGWARIHGALDLSSFSTGMHWDVQKWENDHQRKKYDGGGDAMDRMDGCTKGALMGRVDKGTRLVMRNKRGSNLEGLDGKRNTKIMCTIWFIARCMAYAQNVKGAMKALLYIDDGSMTLDCPETEKEGSIRILRRCLLTAFLRYGFELSLLKTVFSEVYNQFLNEIYFHNVHVGYGFRALCHTGSQSFPSCATVSEELAVISSGMRGAAYSGGHCVRLCVGYHFILELYREGVIGNLGKNVASGEGSLDALALSTPTIAGGWGLPNSVALLSNLAGDRDAEKVMKLSLLVKAVGQKSPDAVAPLKAHLKAELTRTAVIKPGKVPDRLTVAHPSTTDIGSKDRSTLVAQGALDVATTFEAKSMLKAFLRGDAVDPDGSFVTAIVPFAQQLGGKLPVAFWEKALATDPHASVGNLVAKIVTGGYADKFVSRRAARGLTRSYAKAAKARTNSFYRAFRV